MLILPSLPAVICLYFSEAPKNHAICYSDRLQVYPTESISILACACLEMEKKKKGTQMLGVEYTCAHSSEDDGLQQQVHFGGSFCS